MPRGSKRLSLPTHSFQRATLNSNYFCSYCLLQENEDQKTEFLSHTRDIMIHGK